MNTLGKMMKKSRRRCMRAFSRKDKG